MTGDAEGTNVNGTTDANPDFAARAIQFFWEAVAIWEDGGWAMYGIAAIGLIMFGLGTHVLLTLLAKRYGSVAEQRWRRWIDEPSERTGPVGEMLNFVGVASTLKETAARFDELRTREVAPIERDLKVMKVCVSASPLLGLLGTVTGMLATFAALSGGSGGDETMNLIAGGISEALVTTMTGLVLALPGLFFQYHLSRRLERLKAFLAHMETVYTQRMYVNDHELRQAA